MPFSDHIQAVNSVPAGDALAHRDLTTPQRESEQQVVDRIQQHLVYAGITSEREEILVWVAAHPRPIPEGLTSVQLAAEYAAAAGEKDTANLARLAAAPEDAPSAPVVAEPELVEEEEVDETDETETAAPKKRRKRS